MSFTPIKLFCCDLNWSYFDQPFVYKPPAAPHDWAFIDPVEYFEWHREFGNNAMFCQAYTFGGYAFYPTKLGPTAPGNGQALFPALYALAQQAQMPTWSYFCIGADLIMSNFRDGWVVPTSREGCGHGFLAPESPWTELLCARIAEFLSLYPVDWLLFDWFCYGNPGPGGLHVQPAWYVKEPFEALFGRPMPEKAAEITPEEDLHYRREMLARQFHRLHATVQKTSPRTRILFNMPFWRADDPLWVDHPVVTESEGLFAESTDERVLEWLLCVRRPEQRVMTNVIGFGARSDPNSWRKWVERGCDLFGYAWGTPPDFRPHPSYAEGLQIIRDAFHAI